MFVCSFLCCLSWSLVVGDGLLLLYRPRDISSECAASRHLRFDLSFGMGMSDTTTLVFRTLNDFDYGCEVEVATESPDLDLIVVIRYPNSIVTNCAVNRNAFTVLKRSKCLRLCDLVGHRDVLSPYYILTMRERIRFRFISNSSVNSDMNTGFWDFGECAQGKRVSVYFMTREVLKRRANFYQVTVTVARTAPSRGCSPKNETICTIDGNSYCFTSGVYCDGINNCGVVDWFDERKVQCSLPVEQLGLAPVVAVLSALFCALLVAGRALLRCLPPFTASFFIFNVNEDNRLRIDAVLKPPQSVTVPAETFKRMSIIPVSSDSSTASNNSKRGEEVVDGLASCKDGTIEDKNRHSLKEKESKSSRKTTIRSVKARMQRRLRSVTGHNTNIANALTSSQVI